MVRSGCGIVVVLVLSGCGRGCGKPYVPYTIDEAGTTGDLIEAGQPLVARVFDAGPARVAPPNTTSWEVDGVTWMAPEGRVFRLVLAADFDGDGAKEALATVGPSEGAPPAPTELVYYASNGGGRTTATLASAPPAPPNCVFENDVLLPSGDRSLHVAIGSRCTEPTPSRRFVGLVSVEGARAQLRAAVTVTDPPFLPPLDVMFAARDEDQDGRADVTLTLGLAGGGPPFEPGPPVSVRASWLDRPAGLSRQADEPDASFQKMAAGLTARAVKAKEAVTVPDAARQLETLFRAMCPQAGQARLQQWQEVQPLSCGEKGIADAAIARARAFLTMGDVTRALAAWQAVRPSDRTASLRKSIEQAAPARRPQLLRGVQAKPDTDASLSPVWGALAFEPDGKLLVRSMGQVVRVEPMSGQEAVAEGERPWPAQVQSPDGWLWRDAFDPCDGLSLRATFTVPGGEPREILLPVEPSLAPCAGRPSVRAVAYAWTPRGLLAWVGGVPLSFAPDFKHALPVTAFGEALPTRGAPRSPNGRVFALPTVEGVLVRGDKTRLFRAEEWEGVYADLKDCTVSDDGSRVACVKAGRAMVGVWEP